MSDSPTIATGGGDPLAFTPVAVRARHDGWTAERQRAFVDALASLGLVSAAAASVGKSVKSAYALRRRSGAEGFAAAWDAAVSRGGEQALGLAIDRAITGTLVPIFYRGRQVGERRVFDNGLVIAALRVTMRAPATPR